MTVCPHCDYHRAQKRSYVPRLSAPAQAAAGRLIARGSHAVRKRAVLVLVLALLAISGYLWLGESGLDARIRSLSSHHWLGVVDEPPNDDAAAEAARAKRTRDTAAL
ncbi:hypothetical protein AWB79_06460 [Caballeronia hypogeia]|uniref:Uncharacterized protein n=1 Tax=Caballeronia hypogeia TaxID=1777140 RepID=A0A158D533_9BURK|nr:hypothetical protein [Caballeronia hypogeia]SAK89689.1 hypothetical protein AWB79_06460 [Caballeronia hypogeia]